MSQHGAAPPQVRTLAISYYVVSLTGRRVFIIAIVDAMSIDFVNMAYS